MKDHIHLSLDDPYHDTSYSDCSPGVQRMCRPVPFNGRYFTIENQGFDPDSI